MGQQVSKSLFMGTVVGGVYVDETMLYTAEELVSREQHFHFREMLYGTDVGAGVQEVRAVHLQFRMVRRLDCFHCAKST